MFRDKTNRTCTSCEFDTLAIVTVSTGNWSYCPECGGELKNLLDSKSEESVDNTDDTTDDDGMTTISIETPDEEDGADNKNESDDTNKSEENTSNSTNSDEETDSNDTDEDNVDEALDDLGNDKLGDSFVEDELRRLRDED